MNIANNMDWKKLWVPGSLLVLLIFFGTYTLFASTYSIILMISIFMYIILTLSWVLFSSPTGYLSMAPAAFFGVGVYSAAILGPELPLVLVIFIGGLASAILALLIGALTLRLRGIYFAIFTLGLVELIKNLILWYEIEYSGVRGRFVILVDNVTIYYTMLAILVLLLLTMYLIRRSKFGLALRSIGEFEDAAAHVGVNVNALKTGTFAISAIFIGAAGAIMATRWTYIDPFIAFDLDYSFLPILMAIFGGMGQLYGPIIGASLFAYLKELLITRFPYHYMLTFGLILLIVIFYLPGGMVGLIQKWRKRSRG